MTTAAAPVLDAVLPVLGSTGSGPDSLELLVSHQRGRRLLVLRALLDAVRTAPAGSLPEGTAERVLGDWRLLERAERADPAAARRVVHYPLTGAWAERSLRALTVAGQAPRAAEALPHLGALAASAAARAGLRFSADVPVRDGLLTLPTLGGYRLPAAGPPRKPGAAAPRMRVDGDGNRLWLRPEERTRHAVEVRRGTDGVWRSAAPGWRPIQALWPQEDRPDGHPVLIDDADPYRAEGRRANPYGLSAADRLADEDRARWRTAWREAQPWLRLGDGTRAREVAALLDCFVPLDGAASAQYSATLGDAFGALLSSTPMGGLKMAAALVHELQHTKLLALAGVTALHTADDTARYWAPWRQDPRPFDGVFQGAYAHLALADFHLGVALAAADPAQRDAAWAAHCRCRLQVEAVLPQLLGSNRLTPQGRTLVNSMAAYHTRLGRHTPPEGHLARATAYVETARVIWRRKRV
ncbi:aKG-HExxH-type peptide beta-hydroxylase [Streptomyces sp. NPDC088197]|uniref:aKG-HExxH-type peptide beta-hydroxylase n=1 Tax=unclassified Streptomyces TaxID=2593676 RepID=UPI0033A448B6